eukprot:Clim_evm25s6 gene=Clim_evmTU25s6
MFHGLHRGPVPENPKGMIVIMATLETLEDLGAVVPAQGTESEDTDSDSRLRPPSSTRVRVSGQSLNRSYTLGDESAPLLVAPLNLNQTVASSAPHNNEGFIYIHPRLHRYFSFDATAADMDGVDEYVTKESTVVEGPAYTYGLEEESDDDESTLIAEVTGQSETELSPAEIEEAERIEMHGAYPGHMSEEDLIEGEEGEIQERRTRLLRGTSVTFDESANYPRHDHDEGHHIPHHRTSLIVEAEDNWNFGYIVFSLLGLGMLLPWNMFITAADFYRLRLAGTPYENTFESTFSVSYQMLNFLLMGYLIYSGRKFDSKLFIKIPLALQFVILLYTAILVRFPVAPAFLYYSSVVCVGISGCVAAMLMMGLFALVSHMQPRYTQGLMSGQGLGGLAVAILQVLSISLGESEQDGAFFYFIVSGIITGLCVISYSMLLQLPLMEGHVLFMHKTHHHAHHGRRNSGLYHRLSEGSLSNSDPALAHKIPLRRYVEVFKKIWHLVFSVFWIFSVTLAVFPAIAALVISAHIPEDPNHPDMYSLLFIPVYCFVGFNFGDYMGRVISGIIWFPGPAGIPFMALLRTLLVPAFMFCHVRTSALPSPFGGSDLWPILFVLILGLTNGYWVSLCMIYAPLHVQTRDKDIAGTIMSMALTSGLTFGAVTSTVVLAMLCQCNPFTHTGD